MPRPPPIPLWNNYTFSRDIFDDDNNNNNSDDEDNIIIWLV